MKKSFIYSSVMFAFGAMMLASCSTNDNPVDDVIDVPDYEVDERLDEVVPEEIRTDMEEWMPIYDGVNPPNVEGVYIIEPMVAKYCSDREAGWTAIPTVIRFSNQDATNNTLDYADYEGDWQESIGEGAFISGDGNDFTVYFNTIGVSNGIDVKTALVISGTKTDDGIANLHYSFVMVEKSQPGGGVMEEGAYRIFYDEDGMSYNTTWERDFARRMAPVNEDGTSPIWSK